MSLQTDPVAELEPIGGTWIGILLPAGILAVSIGVSWFLYWYFVTRKDLGPEL